MVWSTGLKYLSATWENDTIGRKETWQGEQNLNEELVRYSKLCIICKHFKW